MKFMLRVVCLCLVATSGTALAKTPPTPPSAENQPQTRRSRPNRPSPGLDWIETERNLSREQRMALWLQLFDHNGNGKLDPEEIEETARYRYAQREREAAVIRRQTVLEAERRRAELKDAKGTESSQNGEAAELQTKDGE